MLCETQVGEASDKRVLELGILQLHAKILYLTLSQFPWLMASVIRYMGE